MKFSIETKTTRFLLMQIFLTEKWLYLHHALDDCHDNMRLKRMMDVKLMAVSFVDKLHKKINF